MINAVINQIHEPGFSLYHADCVDVINMIPDNSIGFSIFSPPYSNLYVYSASSRDIGNSKNDEEFYTHFKFVVDGLLRILKPGRNVSVDCMQIPAMKARDGYMGIKDFRGDLIRMFIDAGFIFHSEHCIWKDPLIEATRTKALGLMHKQLCKDSAMCRAGFPQYLLTFRKPGENAEPIKHPEGLTDFAGENPPTKGNLSHERWRRYASPVWDDIDFSNTLNARAARENQDERHICPMSMDIIERAIHLWSNPGDVVYDPFTGIGSTQYVAIKNGRKGLGSELKESYFRQAVLNCKAAFNDTMPLFSESA